MVCSRSARTPEPKTTVRYCNPPPPPAGAAFSPLLSLYPDSARINLFVISFPAFITAMSDLVKTLNGHVSTKDWDKDVGAKLDGMVTAVRISLYLSHFMLIFFLFVHFYFIFLFSISSFTYSFSLHIPVLEGAIDYSGIFKTSARHASSPSYLAQTIFEGRLRMLGK